jgi:hypothetical protein
MQCCSYFSGIPYALYDGMTQTYLDTNPWIEQYRRVRLQSIVAYLLRHADKTNVSETWDAIKTIRRLMAPGVFDNGILR